MALPLVTTAAYLLFVAVSPLQSRPALPVPPIPFPSAPAGWVARVDHPFFPLVPGTVFVYATREGSHTGTDTVTVSRGTKTILGIAATVVRDRTYSGGALAEDTFDWYAQDAVGNVWYLGEDTREYRGGKVVSTAGSWVAGRDGAQAGIVMWAHPQPGPAYRQEYRRGAAEDMARVINVSARAMVPGRIYDGCVMIEEWSPLERGVRERKSYARGVGLVRMQTVQGPPESMELVKVIAP